MTTRKTQTELKSLLAEAKIKFPIGSALKNGIVIKDHKKFTIVTDNYPAGFQLPQGIAYNRFYVYLNNAWL